MESVEPTVIDEPVLLYSSINSSVSLLAPAGPRKRNSVIRRSRAFAVGGAGSSLTIVIVAVLGTLRVDPLAPVRFRFTTSSFSKVLSLQIERLKVFGAVSPSFQFSVPVL